MIMVVKSSCPMRSQSMKMLCTAAVNVTKVSWLCKHWLLTCITNMALCQLSVPTSNPQHVRDAWRTSTRHGAFSNISGTGQMGAGTGFLEPDSQMNLAPYHLHCIWKASSAFQLFAEPMDHCGPLVCNDNASPCEVGSQQSDSKGRKNMPGGFPRLNQSWLPKSVMRWQMDCLNGATLQQQITFYTKTSCMASFSPLTFQIWKEPESIFTGLRRSSIMFGLQISILTSQSVWIEPMKRWWRSFRRGRHGMRCHDLRSFGNIYLLMNLTFSRCNPRPPRGHIAETMFSAAAMRTWSFMRYRGGFGECIEIKVHCNQVHMARTTSSISTLGEGVPEIFKNGWRSSSRKEVGKESGSSQLTRQSIPLWTSMEKHYGLFWWTPFCRKDALVLYWVLLAKLGAQLGTIASDKQMARSEVAPDHSVMETDYGASMDSFAKNSSSYEWGTSYCWGDWCLHVQQRSMAAQP